MGITAHERHDAQRLAQGLGFFVGAVGGRQRFENIGNRHHPRRQAHFFSLQAFRIPGAVHFFVVPAGYFRDAAQVLGERQMVEHQYRLNDVVIDDIPLLARQGAPDNAQVVQLAPVVFVGRNVELEALGIVLWYRFVFAAFEQVLGFVRQ
ncbi:hypothetical protein D3C87_1461580 [compost metagenome]